jgi:hypothetical protein
MKTKTVYAGLQWYRYATKVHGLGPKRPNLPDDIIRQKNQHINIYHNL